MTAKRADTCPTVVSNAVAVAVVSNAVAKRAALRLINKCSWYISMIIIKCNLQYSFSVPSYIQIKPIILDVSSCSTPDGFETMLLMMQLGATPTNALCPSDPSLLQL